MLHATACFSNLKVCFLAGVLGSCQPLRFHQRGSRHASAANGKGVNKRNAGLYELDDDDWGVQVPSAAASQPAAASKPVKGALKALQKAQRREQQQRQQQQMGQEGLISLAMLQQSLEAAGQEPLTAEDLASIKKQMALEASSKPRSKVPAMPGNTEVMQQLTELRAKHKTENARRNVDADDEEDELLDGPDYQLTLGEDGAVSLSANCLQWKC